MAEQGPELGLPNSKSSALTIPFGHTEVVTLNPS